MSETKVEQLRDEGSRMQVVAAGAIAGLVSRYAIEPHVSSLVTQSLTKHFAPDSA
jgi:solute carrier family 25 thiamine pyrophosphate transporter 19